MSEANEALNKIKQSKYSKFIKIGAIVVALIILFNLFSFIFGDRNAKKAQDAMETEIVTMLDEGGATSHNIKSKAIGKNKDASLYAFDTTVKYEVSGSKYESKSFIIVYSDGKDSYSVKEYKYDNDNKKDVKEVALSALIRG